MKDIILMLESGWNLEFFLDSRDCVCIKGKRDKRTIGIAFTKEKLKESIDEALEALFKHSLTEDPTLRG